MMISKIKEINCSFFPLPRHEEHKMQSKIFVILDPQWTKKLHGTGSWQQSLMANDWITRSRWECNKRPTKYGHSQNNKVFLMRKMILAEGMAVVSCYMLIPCFMVSSHYLNGQARIFPFTFSPPLPDE